MKNNYILLHCRSHSENAAQATWQWQSGETQHVQGYLIRDHGVREATCFNDPPKLIRKLRPVRSRRLGDANHSHDLKFRISSARLDRTGHQITHVRIHLRHHS